MHTFKEKFAFYTTAFFYLLFNLRYSPDVAIMVKETLLQIGKTLPYVGGFTYILAYFIQRISGGTWPSWEAIFRIFFTFGIIIGFFFALYEYAATGQAVVK